MKFHQPIFFILLFTTGILFAQDFSSFEYRNVGPLRGGRVTTVTGTPTLPGTFYLGATGGGVWKSEDYGTTWKNVSDGFFDTPSIGAIEVYAKNPNIVYVGTGSDGLRSNVISGRGIYKSVDGGKSWTHIGLKDVGQIGAVEIDPKDPNTVYVAAIGNAFRDNEERGVYKTEDGGATWKKILFVSNQTGFSDLEIQPGDNDVIYAAAWKGQRKPWTIISGGTQEEGGIYKSKNGGKSWEKLKEGLPQGLIGKIDLGVTEADDDVLYAVIEAEGESRGLYRSNNEGKSFEHISDDIRLVNRPFYYTNVEVDPTNEDIVFSMANPGLKSVDGGKTWTYFDVPHGDNHDIWLNPDNPNLLIQANDGGANVSHNGGKTWSTQFNQPTAEIYQVEVDDQYPYWLYGGQQDNMSTIAVPSFPPSAIQDTDTGWIMNTGGCETGPAVPKPGNHNIVYANCKGRFGVFDKRTGTERSYYVGASNIYGHNPADLEYRFQRVAPIHVSPHNPDVVYHGSQFLHKTSDEGRTWETISPDLTAFEEIGKVASGTPITRDITGEEYYSTLYSIRESPVQEGVIWTGANDGPVYLTKDGGTTWNEVTPNNIPKGGRVDAITASHFDPATAYIAVDMHLLGDDKPYILKTNDYGASWELLTNGSNGIPSDHTTRVVREDPVRKGLLYAGTDFGVFISLNDGATWQAFQQNLPKTPITDIKIFRGDLILSTMGRGFWILDDITPLRQDDFNASGTSVTLFKPDTTIRYRYPMASTGAYPQYKRTSVTIDYFLPAEVSEGVSLSILDANDEVIASVVSDSTQLKTTVTEVENMDLSTVFRFVDEKLSTDKGFNRFEWNLRLKGAWDKEEKRSYQYGPLALPGTYTARLKVNGQTLEQSFEIMPDPRVTEQGVTQEVMQEQFDFQNKVIDLLSEAKKFQADLEQQIEIKSETNSSTEALENTLKQLKNEEGAYPQQMLISQIGYLYYMVSGADQPPGGEAEKRYESLVKQLEELKENTTI